MAEPSKSSSPAEQPRWQSGTGLAVGMSLGTALGLTVLDNLAVGLSLGVAVGLGLDALQARGSSTAPPQAAPTTPGAV